MLEDLASSPAAWKRTVPRITPDVARRIYAKLAKQSSYFIYEEGRDTIRGCALRVLRREVQIGARADRGRTWIKVATLRLDVDLEELEELRLAVRRKFGKSRMNTRSPLSEKGGG
jgi:hypothetical protein